MMENGAGVADVAHSGEMVMGNEVLESEVEERAAIGSEESKDSEGEEVFEEAIQVDTPRTFSDAIAFSHDVHVHRVSRFGGSLKAYGNLDAGNADEKFEEAVGASIVVGHQEEELPVDDEKVEGLEPVDKPVVGEVINEKIIVHKVLREEINVTENDVALSTEEVKVRTASNLTGAGENKIVAHKVVREEIIVTESDASLSTEEGKVSNASDISDAGEKEIVADKVVREEINVMETDAPFSTEQVKVSNSSDLSGAGENEIVTDKVVREEINVIENDVPLSTEEFKVSNASDLNGSGEKEIAEDRHLLNQKSGILVEKHENGPSDIVNLENPLLHENLDDRHAVVAGVQPSKESLYGNRQIEQICDPDIQQEAESTREILQEAGKNEEVEGPWCLSDTGHQGDKRCESEVKGNFVNLDTEFKDDQGTEIKEEAVASHVFLAQGDKSEDLKGTSNTDLDTQDDRVQELKDIPANADSDHRVTNWKTEDKLPAFVEERTGRLEVEELPISENSLPENADTHVETSSAVAKESGNGRGNNEVKESTQGERQVESKPAIDVSASSGKTVNLTPTPTRPAGLGRAAPLLEPAPRVVQQPRVNGTASQMQNQLIEEQMSGDAEDNDETREKLQMIRVKFLRLAHRLGQTPHNVVVAQVLYRLGLAEQLRGRNGGRVAAFSFDRASALAEQLEAAGQEPLDFSCTIMVLGKTGVGKSATINSIFDEVKFGTDAFQLGTKKVQDVVGTVQGIKVRVIDTPGLLPSWSDQRHNEKILQSVKRFIKKTPPDIVLYLDRLDMQSRDFSEMPLLRTITEIFGPSIWFNAIVVLTHAASAPPEGPNGTPTSYDMFVTQRSHIVQQAIRQAAGDMRLMNPVSLVENHSACRINRAGQRVLPNGQVWKPHLLLLSFASKILAEANALLKLQDSPPGKPFATRTRAPPLPFLLSSLLQSRPQLKLPEEQFGDDDILDDDLDESSDSDDESEYDELPPFIRLTKAQLGKLNKAQRKEYYAELEYREKLFMKKQLKEEKKKRKMMKKMAAFPKDLPNDYIDNVEEESGGAASVPVPMPDLALPASFDSDNPTHRYRYLDSPNQWVVRPVLDTHGWDHDIGYEGVNVERLFVVKQDIPLSFSGQVTKDKKDANLQMEVASSIKHGGGKATSLGFDMQTLGKDIAYTLRSETRFSNYRQNKATAGLSVTLLGDALTAGLKVEDNLVVNKRFRMVVSGGAMTGRGDVAYGGSLEATLRDKDHPLGRSLSTLGLSIMDWHGDLAIGGNVQSQIPIGRFTNLIVRANLNNRGSGQVSVRLNSSEQLQLALIGLIPLLKKLFVYPQVLQFGQ
ncbi:translocase of chloroplast 120, chloroplastic-like [Diospyros lotus]|uniref:translocase of chloroplast 120, chloroplastic-like n=1 Tax=Diospyros lotus TaxID=55363 RepID=UPI00225A5063|nr:translocase of chloroplast 120, chloroplastic-like [Diospyros lotus]XP_052192892.1 translocase of chloroplast 120, chloroplastic-like [Diospyros lotus]XP_052192893.1 translocase of chloroplast 120, chloroplastic-like [Diospyros lotus]XP_052192894.1 translocase of chloroplast 120, chloroplastic-like [Diospyros lotus]XP_052192895.1 translocase of chloroplast 120, chloroplastic-like [Diospyros lotus]XP_052192896.1 translocase of chloroplast 120, chloroplastic-like [Diospyros lotus]XP_05219289